ncbi:MAG: 2-oxoacid:acceptor oxidoreductase family protein [Thermaerobacter sp.]|nr:2-oxoacid:acceptor oxidoreductase family protein [Thermaerobacter sp.]
MIEVRWHGRGGQGAKTASHVLAVAYLKEGKAVQAFPEYGPERSGAPMLAYTRVDERKIRRRCAVTEPDVVVVLDPSLTHEVAITGGLRLDGHLLLNAEEARDTGAAVRDYAGEVLAVPADRLARESGTRFPNVVLLGALAGWLGSPSLAHLGEALDEVMSGLPAAARAASQQAMQAGYAAGERGMHHGE